ncbi:MAG: TIGR03842 family LLM class F420-dependent oxidoreductase [Anaerolineae bacterium]|nr:TIGR03842 family LLM class F420-dependent oxidoreductase [Anaerolineae bacterium]
MSKMDFGITFKSDMDVRREVKLAQQAEAAGFAYLWTFDSHVLWQECYTRMALWAYNTKRVHIGTLVTNPIVRDITVTASGFATLQRISHGRMDLGIGRGDSSRRVLGKRPTTNENLMHFVEEFRALTAGQPVEYDGYPIQLTWADAGTPPVWVAGYGPKVLTAAGKYADGIILQFADPHLVKWCSDFVKTGAQEAGRDPRDVKIMAAAPVWISDNLQEARERVRWFPALVSNHVVDLLKRHPREDLPPELYAYVQDRKDYNYLHHAEVGSDNAQFVSDEIVDRYCIVGGVKEQIRRLEELQSIGVDQFNIYLMVGDEEKQVATYGSKVIPHFNGKMRAANVKSASAKKAKPKTAQTRKSGARARRK